VQSRFATTPVEAFDAAQPSIERVGNCGAAHPRHHGAAADAGDVSAGRGLSGLCWSRDS